MTTSPDSGDMARIDDAAAAVAAYLQQHETKGLLRFITCGSVDDGKSTLIGRLLFESKNLFDDQMSALTRSMPASGRWSTPTPSGNTCPGRACWTRSESNTRMTWSSSHPVWALRRGSLSS